jgi:hypothetical protein
LVPDPSNPQSWNRYSYVYNRPVILNDPSGHCPQCLIAAGVILIGVALAAHAYNGVTDGYQQPGLQNEVLAAQTWQDNCMGQCHYPQAVSLTPGITIGGTRPSTPISDQIAEKSLAMVEALSMIVGGVTGLSRMSNRLLSPKISIADDAFVSVSPSKYDSSIDELGLLTSYGQESSKRIWFTKYGDIKNVTSATDFEKMLYRKSLWETKNGSFSSGATIREIAHVDNPVAAGVTNMTNGVRQWYTTSNILPTNLRIIKQVR